MAPRFIAKQLSRPSGILGAVIRHLMNRHNARLNAFAVGQLDIQPSDRVLEIGFGGGATLPSLIGVATFVAGIDRSDDVIAWARRRHSQAEKTGRAEFRQGHVESLPFDEAAFDKICTVNTVYFWTSLDAGFAEIYRVLKTGGRAVIGFLPKDKMDRMRMPTDIFTTRAPGDVVAAIRRAGFHDIRIERPTPQTAWNVLVATR
jgi:ubiquinone/menaquinone biosynthesis C-methylase UbiE